MSVLDQTSCESKSIREKKKSAYSKRQWQEEEFECLGYWHFVRSGKKLRWGGAGLNETVLVFKFILAVEPCFNPDLHRRPVARIWPSRGMMESCVPGLAQVMRWGWGQEMLGLRGTLKTTDVNTAEQWALVSRRLRLKARLFHLICYLILGNLPNFIEL